MPDSTEILASLVQRHGLYSVLDSLATACKEQAELDKPSARPVWRSGSKVCDRAAKQAMSLGLYV